MTIADTGLHRFTRAEYDQMAAIGLFENKRVELLDGEILDMPPQNNPHAVTIMLLNNFLTKHLDTAQYMVRPQLPLAISDGDAPEPDIAVAEGDAKKNKDHPTTALLVVEVSVSNSLRRDRRKAAKYAQAGIQEYWIVNVAARTIEQHTVPRQVAENAADSVSTYATVRILTANETITCTSLPVPPGQVEQFLPAY